MSDSASPTAAPETASAPPGAESARASAGAAPPGAAAPPPAINVNDAKTVQNVQAGTIVSETTTFIAEQNVQNLRVVAKYFDDEPISVARPFSSDDAKPVGQKVADELIRTFVGDDVTTTRLLRHLEEHRVLLITGDPDVGKRTVALYLGIRLAAHKSGGSDPLLVDSLDRSVGINLRDVAADAKGFGRRAIVFADAFEQRNNHLREFFCSGDQVSWDHLTGLLRKHEAYFIFTSSIASVPFRQQTTDRIALCELQPLKPDMIDSGIEKRLSWMMEVESTERERVLLLTQNRARLVAELSTLSSAVSFVRHFVRDDSDLESALRRFRDASYWFRTALEHDVDAWIFAFALTLAQPTPKAESAPWADFERIRRALAERIRGDSELFPPRCRSDDGHEPDGRLPWRSFGDDAILQRCRAVIEKDASRMGDIVRFDHPSVTTQLWEAVLTHYRRMLIMGLPVLRGLAEDDRTDWSVRVLAAQIIGRIGEVDPRRIVDPIIHRWAISGDFALRPLVGRVIQGALASGNENYRNAALRSIEMLADVKGMGGDEDARDGLLTAIAAYAQIGFYEPDRAMEQLGRIVIEHLAPVFEKVHQTARQAETVDVELARARANRVGELLRRRFEFGDAATQLFKEHAPALIAIGQVVSCLCLTHEPIPILRNMRDWTAKGGPSTGVLVAFLFLRGIAADLHEIRTEKGRNGSRLLPSLSQTKDAVHHFCGFLADIHSSVNSTFVLPAWLQNDFQDRLGACLTDWACDSLTNADHRQNILDVFVGLATARRGSMRRDVIAILDGTAFSNTESMRSFASQVRLRLT